MICDGGRSGGGDLRERERERKEVYGGGWVCDVLCRGGDAGSRRFDPVERKSQDARE